MKLSQTAVQRLTVLANYMDDLSPTFPDKFHMKDWKQTNWVCGTKACAVGWGMTIPAFQQMGFRLGSDDCPFFDGHHNWAAVRKFFDLTERQAEHLFASEWAGAINTPRQWAEHCRAFLRDNSVEDKGFVRFMVKATEPVKV